MQEVLNREELKVVTINRVLSDYTALRLKRVKDLNLEGDFIDHLIAELSKNENLTLYGAVKEFSEDLELEEEDV